MLGSDGAAIQTGGAPAEGYAWFPPEQSVGEPEVFAEGTPPTAPGQIALNTSAAERGDLAIGDETKVLTMSQAWFPSP